MAELHAEHYEAQTPLQRRVAELTAAISNPKAVIVVAVAIFGWVAANVFGRRWGWAPIDPPPFQFLELAATIAALITTLVILATQVKEEEAARRRAQLTLQLASLSEQKIAKVIQLLEEQRRDSSDLPNRNDIEAEDMGQPADPRQVLERIKDTHEIGPD